VSRIHLRFRAVFLLSGALSACGADPSSRLAAGTAGTAGNAGRTPVNAGSGGNGSLEEGVGGADAGNAGEASEQSDAGATGHADAGAPGNSDSYDWQLPPGMPIPFVPADNPMSAARVELGRHLFYDRRLSGNQTQACSDCHHQDKAFTDGRAVAIGSTGELHPRSAQSLGNVAYFSVLTWANPLMASLETQTLIPIFSDSPVELGMAGLNGELSERLRAEPRYQALFPSAFPEKSEPFELASVVDAISCFERTLISARSPYDEYVYDHKADALDDAQKRGYTLFFSEDADCYHCHAGFNFSDNTRSSLTSHVSTAYHNTGLYDVDGKGAYPAPNLGVYSVTGDAKQMGQFRTPSLRNVELTAPYMHDGSVATLEEVVANYSSGGRVITDGPNAGDGRANPLKDSLVRPLGLSAKDQADLVAFLKSLTDRKFITDSRFANPWK